MLISTLRGATLNWAVAKCERKPVHIIGEPHVKDPYLQIADVSLGCDDVYSPSTDWSQGGLIIEREEICISPSVSSEGVGWYASLPHITVLAWGETPLIAAMVCYVISKLGYEIDIPEELL